MSANKSKQNLRYKKIAERINKRIRYDGLTKEQVSYIKAKREYDQVEKDLNNFWSTVPRKENKSVDWDKLSEQELDYFDNIYKQSEKLIKKMSKLQIEGVDIDSTISIFNQLNCHSASY